MTVATAALVTVVCPGCGHDRQVSPLTVEKIRVGKASGMCLPCGKADGPPIRITPAMRRYWLDRYTLPEIILLAEGLYGPRRQWPIAEAA